VASSIDPPAEVFNNQPTAAQTQRPDPVTLAPQHCDEPYGPFLAPKMSQATGDIGRIHWLVSGVTTEQKAAFLVTRLLALRREHNNAVEDYALFPIKDKEAYRLYQRQQSVHWTASKHHFGQDTQDYALLRKPEKHLIDWQSTFFLAGDGGINMNLAYRFLLEALTSGESMFVSQQISVETIHGEGYGRFQDEVIKDPAYLQQLRAEAVRAPALCQKLEFMEYHATHGCRAERFTAAACSEGIFFVSGFTPIFWFKASKRFRAFVAMNEEISTDETIHWEYYCGRVAREVTQGNYQLDQTGKARLAAIVLSAVAIEEQFVHHILPEAIDDLTPEGMIVETHLAADQTLVKLGLPPHYKQRSILTWKNALGIDKKFNLHEQDSTVYADSSTRQDNIREVVAEF
jgi:ribonucleotide reductase beta subunit family protein with ferritin-like domain